MPLTESSTATLSPPIFAIIITVECRSPSCTFRLIALTRAEPIIIDSTSTANIRLIIA